MKFLAPVSIDMVVERQRDDGNRKPSKPSHRENANHTTASPSSLLEASVPTPLSCSTAQPTMSKHTSIRTSLRNCQNAIIIVCSYIQVSYDTSLLWMFVGSLSFRWDFVWSVF